MRLSIGEAGPDDYSQSRLRMMAARPRAAASSSSSLTTPPQAVMARAYRAESCSAPIRWTVAADGSERTPKSWCSKPARVGRARYAVVERRCVQLRVPHHAPEDGVLAQRPEHFARHMRGEAGDAPVL